MKLVKLRLIVWEPESDDPEVHLKWLIDNDDWISGRILESETKIIDHDDFYEGDSDNPLNMYNTTAEECERYFDELADPLKELDRQEEYIKAQLERIQKQRDEILAGNMPEEEKAPGGRCWVCHEVLAEGEGEIRQVPVGVVDFEFVMGDRLFHRTCNDPVCGSCGDPILERPVRRAGELGSKDTYYHFTCI